MNRRLARSAGRYRILMAAPVALLLLPVAPEGLSGQTIEGVVLHGADSVAVADVPVIVHRITSASGAVVDSTRTGSDGRFRVEIDAEDDPAALYAIAALNGDVSYFGPALHPGATLDEPYTIVVLETETVPGTLSGLTIGFRHVVVSPSAHGLVQVAEVVDVEGLPDRSVRSEEPGEPLWRLRLPDGVQSWAPMEGGLSPDAISLVDGQVEVRATLPPSGMRLSFSYFIEGTELGIPVADPTKRLELILVGAEERKVDGLRAADADGLPPEANAKRFEATNLEPGATVGVELDIEGASRGPALLWALVGAGLLVAAAVSARLARSASG